MPTLLYMEMSKKIKEYKKVKLQHSSGRFYITIPEIIVRKVLDVNKGDKIDIDYIGAKVILTKEKKE